MPKTGVIVASLTEIEKKAIEDSPGCSEAAEILLAGAAASSCRLMGNKEPLEAAAAVIWAGAACCWTGAGALLIGNNGCGALPAKTPRGC